MTIKNELTKYPNGGYYSLCVGNGELGVEGHADVDDVLTEIESARCWLG